MSHPFENVLRFLGYGPPSAPIWFVGLEEGLAGQSPSDSRANLDARNMFARVMDIREAHRALRINSKPIELETMRLPAVWLWMAKIVQLFRGADYQNKAAIKDYVRHKLGRENGETFLTEISPIPRARLNDKRWIADLDHSDTVVQVLIKRRLEELKDLLATNRPDLVVCYGWKGKQEFQDLLSEDDWIELEPKTLKSKQRERFILPFLGNGQMTHERLNRLFADRKPGT